jgi:SAM-dependent methyltransferase
MHLIRHKTCRVCGSSALTHVVDLGNQNLQGSFVKVGKELPSMRAIPTSLVRCDPMKDEAACGLLQMEYTVPPAILYAAYWYRSGTNATMINHLGGIVTEALQLLGKTGELRVLDIGCNDGTLLKNYPSNCIKCGVDPSDLVSEVPNDIRVVKDFFPSAGFHQAFSDTKFDIITSIAMFYDLEDPVGFAKSIKTSLSEDGIWCFEMSYMPHMLISNSYDTICHEHLEYYSLAVIEKILDRAGMKLVEASLNTINGGSLRCYATHKGNFNINTSFETIHVLRQSEFDMELDTDKPYRNFQERINVHRDLLMTLVKKIRGEGKRIHVYGASTKGNTILQWCGLDYRLIEAAADRNPDKNGARTLGTDIPIVSEEISRNMKPDFYLVLPWHFKQEFLEREKDIIANGTRFIFPLPTIEII